MELASNEFFNVAGSLITNSVQISSKIVSNWLNSKRIVYINGNFVKTTNPFIVFNFHKNSPKRSSYKLLIQAELNTEFIEKWIKIYEKENE